jgi:release factor glutamine methyltransferase
VAPAQASRRAEEVCPLPPPQPPPQPPPPSPDLIARLRAAGCVFAEDEARLMVATARTPAELDEMAARRAAGLPLEYVLGWAELCGLRIAVDPGVFVPRRRTEFLVGQAVALARAAAAAGPLADTVVVVDLCCGAGAIGVAVATALRAGGGAETGGGGGAEAGGGGGTGAGGGGGTGAGGGGGTGAGAVRVELHAADIDPAAVTCARRNLAAVGGTAVGGTAVGGTVYLGDLYDPLPATLRGHVGVLTANVPYIPAGAIDTLPAEARVHEPRVALDGGADGLDVLRRVASAAPDWLAPGGHLLVETSAEQAPAAAQAFAEAGLVPQVATSEDLDATVIIGTQPRS